MAAATLPSGIGDPQQALQATWFLRNQPWYQQWLAQQGLQARQGSDVYGDISMSDAQREQLLALARQKGIGISDRYEINPNGQIAEKGSSVWKKIGIGAGIGGLALTGLGAAGIGPLAGLLGASTASAALPEVATTMGIPGAVTAGGLVAPEALALPGAIAASAGGAAAGGLAPLASTTLSLPEATIPAAGGVGALNPGGSMNLADILKLVSGSGGGSTSSDIWKMILGLGGQLGGAAITTAGQTSAADAQAAAAKYAADLSDAANKRAEAFLRQQAESQWQSSEATRQGNYNQWAAQQKRLSNLSNALGAGAYDIPAYVPTNDPGYTSSSTSTTGLPPGSETLLGVPSGGLTLGSAATGAPTSSAQVQPSKVDLSQYAQDPVTQAVIKNYMALGATPTGRGSGPTDYAYMVDQINKTGGLTPQNQAYWFGAGGRIAKELAGGVPPESSGGGQMAMGLPPISQFQQSLTQPLTPTLAGLITY